MSPELLSMWKDSQSLFKCQACAKLSNLDLHVREVLTNLLLHFKESPDGAAFKALCKSEGLLLETYGIKLPKPTKAAGSPDLTSEKILAYWDSPSVLKLWQPLQVIGDGNCLYRAISRAFYGTEEHHLLIRLLVVLEMANHDEYYRDSPDAMQDMLIIHADHKIRMEEALTVSAYCAMEHIYAASAVFGEPIKTYYPRGVNYELTEGFTRKVVGRGVRGTRDQDSPFRIMYSSSVFETSEFRMNHFVVLARKNHPKDGHVDLTVQEQSPSTGDIVGKGHLRVKLAASNDPSPKFNSPDYPDSTGSVKVMNFRIFRQASTEKPKRVEADQKVIIINPSAKDPENADYDSSSLSPPMKSATIGHGRQTLPVVTEHRNRTGSINEDGVNTGKKLSAIIQDAVSAEEQGLMTPSSAVSSSPVFESYWARLARESENVICVPESPASEWCAKSEVVENGLSTPDQERQESGHVNCVPESPVSEWCEKSEMAENVLGTPDQESHDSFLPSLPLGQVCRVGQISPKQQAGVTKSISYVPDFFSPISLFDGIDSALIEPQLALPNEQSIENYAGASRSKSVIGRHESLDHMLGSQYESGDDVAYIDQASNSENIDDHQRDTEGDNGECLLYESGDDYAGVDEKSVENNQKIHNHHVDAKKEVRVSEKMLPRKTNLEPLPRVQATSSRLPSLNGKSRFLEVREAASLLLSQPELPPLSYPPNGPKDNVYFILNDIANQDRRHNNLRGRYEDDCGAWKELSGGTLQYFSYDSNNLTLKTMIYWKNGEFCHLTQINKEKVYVPMKPQPQEAEVLRVHRVYWKLKADETFKKRSTWLESATPIPPFACVEYLGTFPGNVPHGNSKERNAHPYRRTPGVTLETIRSNVVNAPPRQVYRDMKLENAEEVGVPRNSKQVRNAKYLQNKALRPDSGFSRANLADHIIQVMRMAHDSDNPFVRKVITGKGNIPSIILYTEKQITDIRRFCCPSPGSDSTVLGIDKTYNLCDMYVTVFCFKNLSVVRTGAEGGGHPLFMGPILIHADSSFETYSDFFSHLRIRLGEVSGLIIGSDDEKAIKKAIAYCFPEAKSLSCVRHLKQNVADYLMKEGVSATNRCKIISNLFGKNGLSSADSVVQFEALVKIARDLVQQYAPKYMFHLNNRIVPLMRSNFEVYSSATTFPNLKNWHNNNCESVNHILKLAIQWKPQKLLDLIEILKKEVEGTMYAEVERALIGRGDFMLCQEYRRFMVSENAWAAKTKKDRDKHLQNFYKYQSKHSRQGVITSTDGKVAFHVPATSGKKKNQQKRKRAERSCSIKKHCFGQTTTKQLNQNHPVDSDISDQDDMTNWVHRQQHLPSTFQGTALRHSATSQAPDHKVEGHRKPPEVPKYHKYAPFPIILQKDDPACPASCYLRE
jgi:hypothetical protein